MRAVTAQIPGSARDLDTTHADGALVEVHIQHLCHIVVQRAKALHEVGQGSIAKAGVGL